VPAGWPKSLKKPPILGRAASRLTAQYSHSVAAGTVSIGAKPFSTKTRGECVYGVRELHAHAQLHRVGPAGRSRRPRAQAPREFDAASIKMSDFPKDGGPAIGLRFETGRFVAVYVSMQDLIQAAYAVPAGYKIVGPDWVNSMSIRYAPGQHPPRISASCSRPCWRRAAN
jgi:hypothetical protein